MRCNNCGKEIDLEKEKYEQRWSDHRYVCWECMQISAEWADSNCRHLDFCPGNHHTVTSDFFCNHIEECEKEHV